ncbi:hypothetical protein DFH09DRAFT_1321806 [Mycena vulgaris]|nr:hypothetical protein DFH09DRAFT_1321806 [Mycena vulgaris]
MPQSSDGPAVAALQNVLAAMATFTQGNTHNLSLPPASQAALPALAASPAPAVAAGSTATPAVGFLTRGPWVVGSLYQVVPTGPLIAIAEEATVVDEDRYWYCITRGRYVGVTLAHTLAVGAVSGVSRGSMKAYKTQALAVAAFNDMFAYNMIAILA